MKLLIKNVRLADGSERDILTENGKIVAVGECDGEHDEMIDGSGLTALPAFTDLHVHFRDPGFTHKEDIVSGCAAAAAGGFSDVFTMPNTSPACDTVETVKYMIDKAKMTGVRVHPVAAITMGLNGERLTDMEALAAAGAEAFSDDGRPVLHRSDMETAMTRAKPMDIPIFAHCEDLELAGRGIINKGAVSERLGIEGIPHEAEEYGTAREIELAEKTGARLHVCHVSTRASVDMIRAAKKRGVSVTAETGPHYVALTEVLLLTRDADFRMNPPLRTEADRQAIIGGILDGTIDVIATDHAPHAPEEKTDFVKAPNGVVGLETSFAAIYTTLVKTGIITLPKLVELMSAEPRRIAGLPALTVEVGSPADIVLVDTNEVWAVEPDEFCSRAKNSCFKCMELTGRVKYTIVEGNIIYRA